MVLEAASVKLKELAWLFENQVVLPRPCGSCVVAMKAMRRRLCQSKSSTFHWFLCGNCRAYVWLATLWLLVPKPLYARRAFDVMVALANVMRSVDRMVAHEQCPCVSVLVHARRSVQDGFILCYFGGVHSEDFVRK